MAKKDLVSIGSKSFEDLRKMNKHGAEFWSAREITSCKQSGNTPNNHFAGVGKMVEAGKGRARYEGGISRQYER